MLSRHHYCCLQISDDILTFFCPFSTPQIIVDGEQDFFPGENERHQQGQELKENVCWVVVMMVDDHVVDTGTASTCLCVRLS